jgi:hypothetical protein
MFPPGFRIADSSRFFVPGGNIRILQVILVGVPIADYDIVRMNLIPSPRSAITIRVSVRMALQFDAPVFCVAIYFSQALQEGQVFSGRLESVGHGILRILVVSWVRGSLRRSSGVGSSRTAARPKRKRQKKQIW